jgi:branched-chain amino acid transport system permease protein
MNLEAIVSIIIQGLTLGMLYFLIAAGLSLIFGLMDVLNFAHGSIFMIGAYIALTVFYDLGGGQFGAFLPPPLAPTLRKLGFQSGAAIIADSNLRFVIGLLAGTLVGAGLGALIEWSMIRPLYRRPIFQILLTLGLAYVLSELVRNIWGFNPYNLEKPAVFAQSVEIINRLVPIYKFFLIALGLVLFIAVWALLQKSRLGIIIRAGVENGEMVQALGINVRKVFTLVFALGAGLAALGGAAAGPFVGISPLMGISYQLSGFIVVVIGGMGSIPGAAIGSILVGLAQAFAANKLSPLVANAILVGLMGVVLLLKPEGLFGVKKEGGK